MTNHPFRTPGREVTDADRAEPAHRPLRVTVNGEPLRDVTITHEIASRYGVPDGAWEPDRMSVTHMVHVHAQARTWVPSSSVRACCYRMSTDALHEIEAAIMGGPWPAVYDEDTKDLEATAPDEKPAFWMRFRGIPVYVDNTVPWCDFDVVVP